MARSSSTGLTGRVSHVAFYRGVLGKSSGWLYIWAALWLMRRVAGKSSATVIVSEKLQPGQRLMVSNARSTLDSNGPGVVRTRSGKPVPVTELRGRRRRKAERRIAKTKARAAKKAAGSRRARRKAERVAKRAGSGTSATMDA